MSTRFPRTKSLPESGIPLLVVISSPSGGGKTTVVQRLMRRNREHRRAIAATTRSPRRGERNGVAYHFLTDAEFARRQKRGYFVETAQVHDHSYGTPKTEIERAIRQGRVLLLPIDVQGAASIRSAYPDSVTIMLLPPSPAELRRRLRGRKSDSPAVIRRRLAMAEREMAQRHAFDYCVVNRDLTACVDDVQAIIRAERLRTDRGQFAKNRQTLRRKKL